jgi:hypothetical protein
MNQVDALRQILFTPQKDFELKRIERVPDGARRHPGQTLYFPGVETGTFHHLGPCGVYESAGAVIAVLATPLVFGCADGTCLPMTKGTWMISRGAGQTE